MPKFLCCRRIVDRLLLALSIPIALAWVLAPQPATACRIGSRWDATAPAGSGAPPAGPASRAGHFADGFSHLVSVGVSNYDSDCNPWLTSDESEIFFIRASGHAGPADSLFEGKWDIYHADWDSVAGDWGPVSNLGPGVNSPNADRSPTTTADGDTLIFASGAIMRVAIRSGGVFSLVDSLFTGMDPCLSEDGSQLYFVRNYDIWVADRGPSGAITDWVNLRALNSFVNTTYREDRPYISRDGTRLFFADFGGPRPGGYGDADLWVSDWDPVMSDWKPPANMGPPVNSDRPTCTPWVSADGRRIYTASESNEGSRGTEDIWISYADSTVAPDSASHVPGDWTLLGDLAGAWNVYDIIGETGGTLLAATSPEGAVFRSTDDGTSWAKTILPGAMKVHVLMETSTGDLYAGTYPRGRVFRSTDGGASWSGTAPIPGAKSIRSLLETSDGRVLAGASPDCAIFATTDGGSSWSALGATSGMKNSVTRMAEPSPGVLLAGGWGDLNRSINGGSSWSRIILGSGMFSFESFTTDSSGTLWMTGWSHHDQGFVRRSNDDGASWTTTSSSVTVDSLNAVRVYDLVEPEAGSLLVGFQPGPERVACLTTDGGSTWDVQESLSGAREILRFHKDSGGVIYAGTTPNGDLFRWDGGSATGAAVPGEGPAPVRMTAVLGGVPNPFRERTVVSWQVPRRTVAELSIVDVAGRHVRSLFAGSASAGLHETAWDGRDESGVAVASGIYFARLHSGESVTFQRVTRVR